MEDLEKLKYPIGHAQIPTSISEKLLVEWIAILEALPSRLRVLTKDLTDDQLDTPYRPEGWTVRQLIHHISDSHHNSYIRFKWALSEDNPMIKAYDEKGWAQLPDMDEPLEWSLRHLEVVHHKLVVLLRKLSNDDFERTFIHPDGNKTVTLRQNVGQYAWHSNHHYAHIKNLVKREGW